MTARRGFPERSRLAVLTIAVIPLLLAAVGATIAVPDHAGYGPAGDAFVVIAEAIVLSLSLVGGFVAWRVPGNPVGWLLEVAGALRAAGLEFDFAATRAPLDAVRLAERAAGRYAAVIAVGGDGTVHEAVNGLMRAPAEARPALTEDQKRILAYLRQPVPFRILAYLMEREAASHKEILEHVPVSPSTLSHHLKKMQYAGVLARAEERGGYRVASPTMVARLMATYDLATPDQIGTWIRVWGEFRL